MKTKSYVKTGLFAVAAIASATIYYSCSKEDAQQPQTSEFSKTIEVFDDCGLNSVVLKLTSDDQSVVDMYSADNFQLIINPVPYDEPETDAEVDDEEDDDEIYSDDDAVSVSIGVIEERFVEDVQGYELERYQPEGFKNMRAKWSSECFHSRNHCIKVTRQSINRRVYLTTKYGFYGYGESDDAIISTWKDGNVIDALIKNNKSITDTICDCYFVAGVVRCKKHERGKYSVYFSNAGSNCKTRMYER
ncbi:MAG: hypothetical protein IKP62_07755 [Salinivirgaceae bacterium]|nr:hypothetical protein [Salinivirgaceae bacterium]MBR6082802.1 hypothetical protein [Salinivirgaceae bacterium]